jgi:hypothetical protein
MYLHFPSLPLVSCLATALLALSASSQAATVFEIDNRANDTLEGAQEILQGDTLLIGYRGSYEDGRFSILDDDSIDYFRLSLLYLEGLSLSLSVDPMETVHPTLRLLNADGSPVTVDPTLAALGWVNFFDLGGGIEFLSPATADYFIAVSGDALGFATNLAYLVEIQRVEPIPLPAAAWLFAGAALSLAGVVRRRGSSPAA